MSWESGYLSDRNHCLLHGVSLVSIVHPNKRTSVDLMGIWLGSLKTKFANDALFLPPAKMIQEEKEAR